MSCRLLSWERINNSGARPHLVFHPLAWQCLLATTLVTFRGGCIDWPHVTVRECDRPRALLQARPHGSVAVRKQTTFGRAATYAWNIKL